MLSIMVLLVKMRGRCRVANFTSCCCWIVVVMYVVIVELVLLMVEIAF